jgi:hypothetical protein
MIASKLRAEGKIVLCVASSGIASLLLPGGRTAHSQLKIPIPIHEDSYCNIKRGDVVHELLKATSLIICDEIPMLHHHILKCLDCTLHDLLNVDADLKELPCSLEETSDRPCWWCLMDPGSR